MIITQKGFSNLSTELSLLKTKLPKAVDRLQIAREQGDLSENSEYSAAKEDLNNLQFRIKELEKIINDAQIATSGQNQIISIGSKILVELNGLEKEFILVSSVEANPLKGMISIESPVGKALLGQKSGGIVKISTSVVYKIIKIF